MKVIELPFDGYFDYINKPGFDVKGLEKKISEALMADKVQVEQYKKLENKKIPENIDYDNVHNLRTEAVQKLKQVKPINIGQASRISGVSPADVSVLLIYLKK